MLECYMERVMSGSRWDRQDRGGLADIMTKFTKTFKYPISYSYFQKKYEPMHYACDLWM